MSSIILGAEAIRLAGSEAQKAAWLPKLASGDAIATFAYAEGPGSAVDQHQGALEHRAPAQIVVDQKAPFLDDILGRLGETIARHVDEPEDERRADVDIVEFLRPPRDRKSTRLTSSHS